MPAPTLRRSFILFHLALGLGLLAGSLTTLLDAGHHGHHPLALLAGIEALGAALFLFPRTLRIGASLLLLTLAAAIVAHAMSGEWRFDLTIYLTGVWFVMVHGSGWLPATHTSRAVA
jgi:hypothetical protein